MGTVPKGYAMAYAAALSVAVVALDIGTGAGFKIVDGTLSFILVGGVIVILSCALAGRRAEGYDHA